MIKIIKSFIVTLEDNTTYNVSANDSFLARTIIDYGLRNRLNFRKVVNVVVEGLTNWINKINFN